MAILAGGSLATLRRTTRIQGRDETGDFTRRATVVTFAGLVLNLAMLGDIFTVTSSENAFLPWAALAFLPAYAATIAFGQRLEPWRAQLDIAGK